MKIAYCYSEILPSNVARSIQVVNTCAALAKQVRQVIFYIPAGYCNEKHLFSFYNIKQPENLKICFCKKKWGFFSSNQIFNYSLRRAVSDNKPDIMITRHLKTADALINSHTPLIFEAHEIFSNKKSSALKNRVLENRVFAGSQGVICLTKGLSNALQNSFSSRACFSIVPSGTKVSTQVRTQPALSGKKLYVTYVGTTRYRWKGISTLMKAMVLLPEHISLEIVGDLNQIYKAEKAVLQLTKQKRLKITGHLPPNKAALHLKKAQVAVIPNSGKDIISRIYTSPLKLLEAMAEGLPVVASDLPSIREIVSEDQAVLVTPDDPGALAEGILKLFQDAGLRTRIAKNAWLRAKDFSWEKRAGRIIKMAREVLNRASN